MEMAENLDDAWFVEVELPSLSLGVIIQIKTLGFRKREHVVKNRIGVRKRNHGTHWNNQNLGFEASIMLVQLRGSRHDRFDSRPFQINNNSTQLVSRSHRALRQQR